MLKKSLYRLNWFKRYGGGVILKHKGKKVLVFVRVPESGRVKTRLLGKLDKEDVCQLYRCFVEDILGALSEQEYDIVICYNPPEGRWKMISWLGSAFTFMPQRGASLGERMENAFADMVSQRVEQTVLIGSDFPDLDAGIIDEAFEGLETHDLVVGPAVDGGYYLIGFNAGSFLPKIFRGIPWGTQHVFHKTAALAKKNNLSMYVLPKWRDIDTPDDLKAFFLRAREKGLTELKTMKYLERKDGNRNPESLYKLGHDDCR
jgi:rSAM/selenodomain-associated transferase 1